MAFDWWDANNGFIFRYCLQDIVDETRNKISIEYMFAGLLYAIVSFSGTELVKDEAVKSWRKYKGFNEKKEIIIDKKEEIVKNRPKSI